MGLHKIFQQVQSHFCFHLTHSFQRERSVFKVGFKWCLWRRKWQPTPELLPGKSHGWRSVVGYSSWDHKELDTTERLHFLLSFFKWCMRPESLKKKNYWSLLALQGVLFISTVQQSQSAICVTVSPLFGFPSHLGHQRGRRSGMIWEIRIYIYTLLIL